MKQLELKLKKRLLIVEMPEFTDMNDPIDILNYNSSKHIVYSKHNGNMISRNRIPDGEYKLICKGSELTEDIANELVELHVSTYRKDYLNDNNFFILPTESFISAIEAKGYYWGVNPYKIYDLSTWHNVNKEHQEAESRTFNLEKTLIFEILENDSKQLKDGAWSEFDEDLKNANNN